MRIELSGSIPQLKPIIIKYTENSTFEKAAYVALGYTNFDVIAIAGGGGAGGGYKGLDYNDSDIMLRSYGGEGGGGGFHRVQGLIDALADSVDVLVGVAGADGDDLLSDSGDESDIFTTDGEVGTGSQFGGACYASAGNGGKRVYSATLDISPNCDGGDGGLGGQLEDGWGGKGGVAGTFADLGPEPGVPGVDGPLFKGPYEFTEDLFTIPGLIGKGGGGGAGGVGVFDDDDDIGTSHLDGTDGGRGSYKPADQSVFGYGTVAGSDPDSGSPSIVPGMAGGARTTPLDGSNSVYGRSGQSGVVLIRLTVE